MVLLLVAAGSATAGIFAGRDGAGSSGGETVVALSRVIPAPPAPPAQLRPTTPVATAPAPRPRPTPTRTPTPRRGLREWPARSGFTVVLASIPARGTGRADAEQQGKEALARGLRDVGVLDSSKFPSLHPGYYVVFSGVYGSLADAETAAAQAHGRFPNAYARPITR
jgi:hypothetical protein